MLFWLLVGTERPRCVFFDHRHYDFIDGFMLKWNSSSVIFDDFNDDFIDDFMSKWVFCSVIFDCTIDDFIFIVAGLWFKRKDPGV